MIVLFQCCHSKYKGLNVKAISVTDNKYRSVNVHVIKWIIVAVMLLFPFDFKLEFPMDQPSKLSFEASGAMKSSYWQERYHPELGNLFLKMMRLEIVFIPLLKVSPYTLTSYANFVLLVGQNLDNFNIKVLTKLTMAFLKMQHMRWYNIKHWTIILIGLILCSPVMSM